MTKEFTIKIYNEILSSNLYSETKKLLLDNLKFELEIPTRLEELEILRSQAQTRSLHEYYSAQISLL